VVCGNLARADGAIELRVRPNTCAGVASSRPEAASPLYAAHMQRDKEKRQMSASQHSPRQGPGESARPVRTADKLKNHATLARASPGSTGVEAKSASLAKFCRGQRSAMSRQGQLSPTVGFG
jgi:hypothetical protein